jgi:hypothetical protein
LNNITEIFKVGYSDMVRTLEDVYHLKRVKEETSVDFCVAGNKKEFDIPQKIKEFTDSKKLRDFTDPKRSRR